MDAFQIGEQVIPTWGPGSRRRKLFGRVTQNGPRTREATSNARAGSPVDLAVQEVGSGLPKFQTGLSAA